ncbi:MAG TPA: hypothetical protein PKK68_09115 [Methanothrix soehngenii]|jgi:hypothetical protein|nr:hypothetical protein [Methanothrix soehngenii]
MKATLASIICVCIALACIPLSSGSQSVGEDFGTSWLEKYGTKPISTLEIANNLWNWGGAPKGFGLHEGILYPPGTEPQWYYPTSYADYTPIIINRTDSRSSASQNLLSTDPWLLSQLSGRPVVMVKEPKGTLF